MSAQRERFRQSWNFDPSVAFLNHGSFGGCPEPVLAAREAWLRHIEREPVDFYSRELPRRMGSVRECLGAFLGAEDEDLALMPNVTTGISTVLRGRRFDDGEELLTTDHAYPATLNALKFAAKVSNARVVIAKLPLPASKEGVVAAVLSAATSRTRLCVVDHVTSSSGLRLPVADIVRALGNRGVDTLIDGAHAPGMFPLSVAELGAAYYAGNCHKWMCAPRGAGFLWVRSDRQEGLHPLAISHGYDPSPAVISTAHAAPSSSFRAEFDWTGTSDPSAHLCIEDAIRFLSDAHPQGIDGLMSDNAALSAWAHDELVDLVSGQALSDLSMRSTLASVRLWPDGERGGDPVRITMDPLTDQLFAQHRIEVPVFRVPGVGTLLRMSAHAYNLRSDYERLFDALSTLRKTGRIPPFGKRKAGP